MILGPVSLIDCAVFCVFLAPQLIVQVGLLRTLLTLLRCLPFLLARLPVELVTERYITPRRSRSKFVQGASLFEDLVIRCVRYAFSNVPAEVGRVFFSKPVALPFIRWRMLRHGHFQYPASIQETSFGSTSRPTRGLWVVRDHESKPDFVVYYIHGGGFAMGSSYFYLEFLMAMHHLLLESGYANPAIFALEYTLVPDDTYPRQVNEAIQGYKHVVERVSETSKICLSGDSAGGTIALSLLLELGSRHQRQKQRVVRGLSAREGLEDHQTAMLGLPQLAVLISPWVTLLTDRHSSSKVDFLDRDMLWQYAAEYAGKSMIDQTPASPGSCTDESLWLAARPHRGYFVAFGDQEVFALDAAEFVQGQRVLGVNVASQVFEGGVHAWPVASLFLSTTKEKRLLGLRTIVSEIRKCSTEQEMAN